jgi:hypothetical protein
MQRDRICQLQFLSGARHDLVTQQVGGASESAVRHRRDLTRAWRGRRVGICARFRDCAPKKAALNPQ